MVLKPLCLWCLEDPAMKESFHLLVMGVERRVGLTRVVGSGEVAPPASPFTRELPTNELVT